MSCSMFDFELSDGMKKLQKFEQFQVPRRSSTTNHNRLSMLFSWYVFWFLIEESPSLYTRNIPLPLKRSLNTRSTRVMTRQVHHVVSWLWDDDKNDDVMLHDWKQNSHCVFFLLNSLSVLFDQLIYKSPGLWLIVFLEITSLTNSQARRSKWQSSSWCFTTTTKRRGIIFVHATSLWSKASSWQGLDSSRAEKRKYRVLSSLLSRSCYSIQSSFLQFASQYVFFLEYTLLSLGLKVCL